MFFFQKDEKFSEKIIKLEDEKRSSKEMVNTLLNEREVYLLDIKI